MANELLGAKIERLEIGRPLARRRLRPTPRDGSRGDPGGDEPPGLALHGSGLWPAAGGADLGRVASDRLPPSPPAGGDRAPAIRAARCHGGRRAGASDPAAPDRQSFSWRRPPQAVGAAALRRPAHQPAPRPASDARARPPGLSACRPLAWLASP